MPVSVIVVDDHDIVREGLKMFVDLDPDIEVIGEASNGEEAIRVVERLKPDVVLMDLMMPKMGGIEAIGICKEKFPETEIIALTSVLEDRSVVQAVKNGATGYLLKNTAKSDLCNAIKAASEGKVQFSPEAQSRLMKSIQARDPVSELTERELEVLKLLAGGASNRDIAEELFLAEKTIKTHVSNVLSKLAVKSRTQAAIFAWQKGLVDVTKIKQG